MVGAAIVFPNPVILLIVLFAVLETWRRWKAKREGGAEQQAYYTVKPAHRRSWPRVYLGLIVPLAFGMYETFLPRTL